MKLDGSCHCGAVHFRVDSHTPQPFMRCYCSICRKTAGGGGYAINIMGEAATLAVRGMKSVAVYRARLPAEGKARRSLSPARRHFCAKCGSALWVADPRWPEWVYPFASAIDTPLPRPPEESSSCSTTRRHGRRSRPGRSTGIREYPEESIADWHRKRGLEVPERGHASMVGRRLCVGGTADGGT